MEFRKKLSSFTGEDYQAESFVSSRNTKCEICSVCYENRWGGKKEKKPEEKTEKKETILDKIKGLFS